MKPFLRPLVLAAAVALAVPLLSSPPAQADPNPERTASILVDGLLVTAAAPQSSPSPEDTPTSAVSRAAGIVGPTTTTSTRCVAGRIVVTVTATNPNAFPVKMTVTTGHGSRPFAEVGAGKTVTAAFSARTESVPAGLATTTSTAFVAGKPASATTTTPTSAGSCS